MKELSIFGVYAGSLQVLLDTRAEKFNKPWYVDYFEWDTPQISLDFTSVLGQAVIAAAASIVARDGETPLRSREALAKITGEIPAIKEMFPLNENQYRNYMALKNMPGVTDQQKKNQALKLIWDDAKKVVEAVHNRLDMVALQAVSTGTIDINVDNNPDGLVIPDIDLLMPAGNKIDATTEWMDPASTPIQDIQNVINTAAGLGFSFEKILIDQTKWMQLSRNKEFKDTLGAFFGLTKTASGSETAPLTVNRFNQYMEESKLPQIEVVNRKIGVEKNGKVTLTNPFEAKNISFIPGGKLGTIKNALAVEEMEPVENVSYATQGRVLVSKWKQNEPWREWTKSECNAWPVLEAINNIFILKTEA